MNVRLVPGPVPRWVEWGVILAGFLTAIMLSWGLGWNPWIVLPGVAVGTSALVSLVRMTTSRRPAGSETSETIVLSVPEVMADTVGPCAEALENLGLLTAEVSKRATATLTAQRLPCRIRELDVLALDHGTVLDVPADAEPATLTYSDILQQIAAVSKGALAVSDVQERQSSHGVRVAFALNGSPVSLRVHSSFHGLDVPGLLALNELVPRGCPHLYVHYGDNGRTRLLFLSQSQRSALGKRGWTFGPHPAGREHP